MISENELKLFSRQLILNDFNDKNFKFIQSQNIVIVGIGGIGCPVAQYLVSSGIKNLTLIDNDIVQLTNLNRQILYSINNVGEKKVEVANKILKGINEISIINFDHNDVIRHPLVTKIVEAYQKNSNDKG